MRHRGDQRHLTVRPGQPAITYGLCGIAFFELLVTGPKQDLHSGTFGGAVTNPINAICKLLASLIDDRRVQVPGFYDDVLLPTDRERADRAHRSPTTLSGGSSA
jgi:succinyl-diaminopimelate desuccinylase